uniref:NADH-quinone oxidoreductase subunit M n=1 Tax=Candidatus Kentrum sp. TUN TaxID=2126343 RepID=A0A450ZBQ5_9GAMM|nr:MAG: NADH dehydrogenase subunit M [Candidatus Kentron sp. TUN]VFK50836.1 MAG: NADH dehydrogenase subunit M [Candidatus Kentron sp. TUN]VFK51222.1 MAG: NADH dehydrogenase subunit M [Candidatus Kentron sp. TUN]
MELPWLSIVIWTPIFGGLWVLVAGNRNAPSARSIALVITLLTFLFSIPLYIGFDNTTPDMQFTELVTWIPAFHINYRLGIDGFSMPLILLTTFTTVLVVLAAWQVIKEKTAQYMAAFLIQEGFMIGVFAALDAMLFYIFWEALLIPMFLIIGIWGGPNRIYASVKFFLFTFVGSIFMLVALLYLYSEAESFAILDLHQLKINLPTQILIFLGFLIAFAVKVPMWPVHTWLPDAHVEAPTGGSVILAAIMLKLGGYGFIRFSLPITPDASHTLDWLMIGLSLIAIVYISFVALVQLDMKKLIAYSSISHMGFVTLGFFLAYQILENTGGTHGIGLGIQGGMMQMISHGFISSALFLCIGMLYDRIHSRQISSYGGVANTMPLFAAFMMLFAMANSGLPGTSGFVGEFMVILASFKAHVWVAFLAAIILILGAAYTLWMYKRVVYGPVTNKHIATLTDINAREFFILMMLAVVVLFFGIWPAPLLEIMGPSTEHLVEHILISKIPL